LALRARHAGWVLSLSKHADQIRLFPHALRAASSCWLFGESEAAMAAGKGKADGAGAGRDGDGAEVAEDRTQVVEYAAAIDVAKGSGMVCTRVPGSRPDRRRQRVWRVEARFAEVTALMDHLRCEGIHGSFWNLPATTGVSGCAARRPVVFPA
jgi:hypothetical protein